jgi:nucleotide-binding universal stress UspA family protein
MKLGPLPKSEQVGGDGASPSPTSEAPVLIGFDGADGGRDALVLGQLIATARGSSCIVALPDEETAVEVRAALADEAVETREIGILAPQLQLVECAKAARAGALVVGSTRRGTLGRAMLGSTAKQVLHKAPCEVAVAPRGYADDHPERLSKIAVAVDGTPDSRAALARAEDLAHLAGAEIEVLVAPGRGRPAGVIAAALAKDCEYGVDLLIAGSRRPLDRFRQGSVTNHLIAAAPCPVLVVPQAR